MRGNMHLKQDCVSFIGEKYTTNQLWKSGKMKYTHFVQQYNKPNLSHGDPAPVIFDHFSILYHNVSRLNVLNDYASSAPTHG